MIFVCGVIFKKKFVSDTKKVTLPSMSESSPTPDDIKKWLKNVGQDRHWLAEQIGSKKHTVDQMFSKGFSEWALRSISNLMRSYGNDGGLKLKLTAEQWEEIDQACSNAGFFNRSDFFREAIIRMATEINSEKPAERGAEDATPSGGKSSKN